MWLTVPPAHRRALGEARRAMGDARYQWAQALAREQEANRQALDVARKALESEKNANASHLAEHTRVFRAAAEQVKAEAHNYRVVYLQAKQEAKRLLPFVERILKRAA